MALASPCGDAISRKADLRRRWDRGYRGALRIVLRSRRGRKGDGRDAAPSAHPPPSGGGGLLSWVYIEDAAAATAAALEKGEPGQAYNVVDDEPVSWRDFMKAMAKAVGAPSPLAVPRLALRLTPYFHTMMTSTLRVSNAKAKRELDWTPSVPTYRQGIERVAASLSGDAPVAA